MTDRERRARNTARMATNRSPIARDNWTPLQFEQHIDWCWTEYAELLEDGVIDDAGRQLKALP